MPRRRLQKSCFIQATVQNPKMFNLHRRQRKPVNSHLRNWNQRIWLFFLNESLIIRGVADSFTTQTARIHEGNPPLNYNVVKLCIKTTAPMRTFKQCPTSKPRITVHIKYSLVTTLPWGHFIHTYLMDVTKNETRVWMNINTKQTSQNRNHSTLDVTSIWLQMCFGRSSSASATAASDKIPRYSLGIDMCKYV